MIDLVTPEGLSAEVIAVWNDTVNKLKVMELAFPSDSDVLRCYCEAVVLHRRACVLLSESELVVQGAVGYTKHPALQIQREAAAAILSFAKEFGLTPSARGLLGKAKSHGLEDNSTDSSEPSVLSLDDLARKRNVRKRGASG